jgi:bifunctional DNA-binding transcriptional regulator/antitoxin component of YhaV-PrlF toxin-antitoxin module
MAGDINYDNRAWVPSNNWDAIKIPNMIRDDYGLSEKKPLGIVYVENGKVHIVNVFSVPAEHVVVESIDDIKKIATKKMLKGEEQNNFTFNSNITFNEIHNGPVKIV